MDEQAKVIARIRKLLNLANNAAASEGERDNAMRMAHATMAKYNLDLAEIEAKGQEVTDEPRERAWDEFYGRPWARTVCSAMAKLFFCTYIYTPATKAKDTRHHFIGRKSNAITAMEMSRYLVESIMKEAKRDARQVEAGNAWVRSFCTGASLKIAVRVRAMIEEATKPQAASTGTSLVLANHYQLEAQKNQELKAKLFPVLGTGRQGKGEFAGSAMERGSAYGSRVSLSRQVTGASSSTPKLK